MLWKKLLNNETINLSRWQLYSTVCKLLKTLINVYNFVTWGFITLKKKIIITIFWFEKCFIIKLLRLHNKQFRNRQMRKIIISLTDEKVRWKFQLEITETVFTGQKFSSQFIWFDCISAFSSSMYVHTATKLLFEWNATRCKRVI